MSLTAVPLHAGQQVGGVAYLARVLASLLVLGGIGVLTVLVQRALGALRGALRRRGAAGRGDG